MQNKQLIVLSTHYTISVPMAIHKPWWLGHCLVCILQATFEMPPRLQDADLEVTYWTICTNSKWRLALKTIARRWLSRGVLDRAVGPLALHDWLSSAVELPWWTPGNQDIIMKSILHFISWKKDSELCCDTSTPESIHTKDESKRGSAFAFIFGVNWPVQWM